MTSDKMRWGQHPECAALEVLEICKYGLWYRIPGTTVHSTNDALKVQTMNAHSHLLYGRA